VFVHGIFGSSTTTWSCSSSTTWPKLLKTDDAFQNSDIYVAGYDTPYHGNTMTIDEIVSNLKNRLDSDEVFSKHREVVFVAHSLGGLIVQKLLLTYRNLAGKVRFIYFYSTPQTGAQIAQLGNVFSSDPLLKQMLPGDSNDYLLSLENEWREAGFTDIRRYCAYEKKQLDGVLIVDRLSGTRECSDGVVAINEDHPNIVKPCTRNADSYIALRLAVQRNPIVPEKLPIPQNTLVPLDSVTVTLPNGLSLKAAIISIAETDNASARFSANCGQTVLKTTVRGGPMSAGNRAELINQLQYRLINPGSTIALKVGGPSDGGVYDIDCVL
jgi:hypothetical protein